MRTAHPAILAIALVLSARPASADWPARGRLVTAIDNSLYGSHTVPMEDLASCELQVLSFGTSNGPTVERLQPNGDVAAGWPETGVPLYAVGHAPNQQGFAVDDSGCVWRASMGMEPGAPSAQLLRPDALRLPEIGGW